VQVLNIRWIRGDSPDTFRVLLKTRSGWKDGEVIPPDFFVREGETPPGAEVKEGGWRGPKGEKCVRVEVSIPSAVPAVRPEVSYLADLPYVRKYSIDTGITYDPDPRVLFYDVEASAERGMPDPKDPQGRILSIAAVDRDGREFFICERDEAQIYEQFMELAERYDFLVGYNSGRRPTREGWDLPYLAARAKRMGCFFDWRLTCWGDLMDMYEKTTQHRAGSLASLAERVLGRKMEKPVARGQEILRWFHEDRSRLEQYNLEDCLALRELDRELGLVGIYCHVANLAKVSYTDAQSPYCVVDNLVIEEGKRRRLVFPTSEGEGEGERPEGALVLDPVPGLHHCHIYDFKSTYPSLIATFNISPETVGGDIRTEVLSFSSEERGVFPTVAERLMEERARSSGLKAEALKVCANSMYGAMGFRGSRYYSKELAESITLTQRRLLLLAKSLAERMGRRVLYADTDSLLLDGSIDLDEFNERLKHLICYEYGVPERWFRFRLADKGEHHIYLPREKKRYVLFDAEGRIEDIKGFEPARKNTPKIVARVERELFQVIGSCIPDPSSLERRAFEYLSSLREELMSGRLDGELTMRSGIEDVDGYKAKNAPHVKAARKLREMGYPVREEVEFVIADVDGSGLVVEPVIGGKIPPISHRAREHYWQSRILPRVEAILGKRLSLLDTDLRRWF